MAAQNRALNLPAFPKMSKGISDLGRLARELTDELPMLESSEYELLQQSAGARSLMTNEIVLNDVVEESWLIEGDSDEGLEQIEKYHRRQRALLWSLIAAMAVAALYLGLFHVRPMALALEQSRQNERMLEARTNDFEGLLAAQKAETKALEDRLSTFETEMKARQERELNFFGKSAAVSAELLDQSVSAKEARVREQTRDSLIIDVSDRALFDRGQSELTERGKLVLCQSGLSLADGVRREISLKKSVVGSKGRKLSPRAEADWQLSTARAMSVARFLQEGGCDGKAREIRLTINDRSR